MSDALSDIARDGERARLYRSYLEALEEFLKDPTDKNKKAVLEIANETDSIRGGYWGGRSFLSNKIETIISKLQEGDKEYWAKFLFSLKNQRDFEIFKPLSPFAGKFLIAVNYGCGFVNFHGELESFINSIIRKSKGWETYDADDYLIALDELNTENAETFWVGCGISGVDGPRKAKK